MLAILISFILSFSFSLIYPYLFSPLRHVPGPSFSQGHPLWGAYPSILRSEAGLLQREWALRYGKVVRAVGPLGLERLVFTSANALKTILVDQHLHFEKVRQNIRRDSPFLNPDAESSRQPKFVQQILGLTTGSRGLLAATGADHKALRTLLSPAFAPSNVLEMQGIFYDHAESMVERIKAEILSSSCYESVSATETDTKGPEKVIPVYEWSRPNLASFGYSWRLTIFLAVSRLALDNISSTAFGRSTLSENIDQLAEAYHRVLSLQSGTNITKFIALLQIPAMYDFLRSEVCWKIVQWCGRSVSKWLPAAGE